MTNIKKRIAVSFFANCFKGGATLFVGVSLARFLGAEDYGTLVFLVAASMAIKQLLDFGSSSAFFTFLSQEARSVKFIAQFLAFFFVKYIITIVIILFVLPGSWLTNIWLGNSSETVIIALMAVAFQSDFWIIASQLLESQRKTIRVQILFVITQLIHFGFIFTMHYFGILSITNYFIFIIFLWLMAGVIAVSSYEPLSPSGTYSGNLVSVMEYIKYCLPLTPVIALNFTGEFLDKWMLQNWGGGKEQAYFAISVQIASISLLITASFIKIFWKEVAEAFHKEDSQSAFRLYLMSRKAIFYCGAFIAAAVIPWTSEVLGFLYGQPYVIASTPLILLMIYSIHQSIGQLDNAFLMASGKTSIGLNFNILFSPIGIFISYILLSNSTISIIGLGLGATGLAIKMVITQLISVNIIVFLIQKKFNIKFSNLYQIQVFILLVFISTLIKIVLQVFNPASNYIFAYGLFLYVLCWLGVALVYPRIIALPVNWLQIVKRHLVLNHNV